MAPPGQHFWMVPVGALGAFLFGWATGANDVANAFGTSVGAKTLTMAQATVIAGIFEFTGAMVLGRVVTSTIAGGIADVSEFKSIPYQYSYGMMWTTIVGGVWQAVACHYEWNVSATHSIIGGIIGFAFAAKGPEGVLWKKYDPTVFPPYKGIVPIVLSWFFAPILTGSSSAAIFWIVRKLVLRQNDPQRRSLLVFPPLMFFTSFINIYFVFTKGMKKYLQQISPGWNDSKALWITLVISTGLAIISYMTLPFIKKRIQEREDAKAEKEAASERGTLEKGSTNSDEVSEAESASLSYKAKQAGKKMLGALTYGVNVDIHKIVEEDDLVAAIHRNGEVFDEKAEAVFAYLQVFSAICVILAHGAGEVGYMAGPLGMIFDIHKTGKISKKIQPPVWITVYCALSLVIGLGTYGYNVTRAMGTRMCKLTPSRGFAAELATALVILVASQWGLPNSSSQCITGGIIGVGILEGAGGVNWGFFAQTFSSWMATIVLMAGGTGLLFAQGVYAPCRAMAR